MVHGFMEDKDYFTDAEFKCPCCGKDNHSEELEHMLNNARHIAGVLFIINSACRCKKHNASKGVSGKSNSSHLKGLAVDIECRTSRARAKIMRALELAGFTRMGIAETFIHVDIDPDKDDEVYWIYKNKELKRIYNLLKQFPDINGWSAYRMIKEIINKLTLRK